MAVKHTTAADGTFSALGDTEWERDHTVEDGSFVAAKISFTGTDFLLGRSTAGAGNGEEIACSAAARTVLDDATVGAMVDTLGGASSTGTGGLVRTTSPALVTPDLTLKDESVSADGELAYNRTTEELNYHNGQRALTDEVGWAPYATGAGFQPNSPWGASVTIAAAGGSVAIPIFVNAHMLFRTLLLRQNSTSSLREAEWRLYRQRLNNGNATENTLDEVPNANGTFSFTPSAASNESSTPSTVPIYLAPGCYWLVIRNTHASNTFVVAALSGGALSLNTYQTKTLGSALGATLDFVAATWTKVSGVTFSATLRSSVFGQTTVF